MPTARQSDVFRSLERKFGRTDDFRTVAEGVDFARMDPGRAYVFLARVIDAVKRWRYIRLPRAVGLPRTEEERQHRRILARREERVARLAVPDDEREHWQIDTRPSAFESISIPYAERNPELVESLEIDYPGFRRFRDVV